jgi:hypothetical protein
MYTSYIGKKFLKLYNERNKTELSPKDFFDSVQFPIFFDNKKHLMHVHGSTFFQKVGKEYDSKERESVFRLKRLHENVSNNKISASTYVGYAAEKPTGVTSGQVSSIKTLIDEDEIYASWIGAGLGIGVEGRFVFLADHNEIIWKIFEGWQFYRDYLNQTPNIKDKEIEFWNACWLTNTLSSSFDPNHPTDSLDIKHSTSVGETRINKKTWSEVLLCISKKYYDENKLAIYAYQLDKTNTTLGFINAYLKSVHELYEWRDYTFIDKSQTILSDRQIEQLETQFKFKDACAIGTIGLKALEPARLREFMPKDSVPSAQGKNYKFNDEESYINYKLFKIWIYAMLNKKEIIQLADQLALILLKYENAQKEENRGKTGKGENVKKAIESRFFKEFAENIKPLITKENSTALEEIVQKAYLEITTDNFPLFLTLVRFQYQILQKKS